IFTLTMPPPALASTTSSLSCSWAFSISLCICCACFIRALTSKPPGMPPLATSPSPSGGGPSTDLLSVEFALQLLDQRLVVYVLVAGLGRRILPVEQDVDRAHLDAGDRNQ